MRLSRHAVRIVTVLACCWAGQKVAGQEEDAAPGFVQFSDGESLRGAVTLAAGGRLRIHTAEGLRTLRLEQVAEMRFTPEKECLEQKWRFIEAGKPMKERWGKPYPVRHLRARIVLAGGESISGHLYTCPLYVASDEHVEKVVLTAKQRGRGGQALRDLRYPVRVAPSGSRPAGAWSVRVTFDPAPAGRGARVAAVAGRDLVRLAGRRAADGGLRLPPPYTDLVFLAVRDGARIVVAWPREERGEDRAAVSRALEHMRDFFDDIRTIRVWRDGDMIYSLMMLRRRGATTLGTKRNRPWRCGVWRWKESADRELLLAGRGYLFRGALEGGERAPVVVPSPALWDISRGAEDVWTIPAAVLDGGAHGDGAEAGGGTEDP